MGITRIFTRNTRTLAGHTQCRFLFDGGDTRLRMEWYLAWREYAVRECPAVGTMSTEHVRIANAG